jgi:hypothetical protein
VEERAERDFALGPASRSFKALLEPGETTRHLMRYSCYVGMVQDEGGHRGGERNGEIKKVKVHITA